MIPVFTYLQLNWLRRAIISIQRWYPRYRGWQKSKIVKLEFFFFFTEAPEMFDTRTKDMGLIIDNWSNCRHTFVEADCCTVYISCDSIETLETLHYWFRGVVFLQSIQINTIFAPISLQLNYLRQKNLVMVEGAAVGKAGNFLDWIAGGLEMNLVFIFFAVTLYIYRWCFFSQYRKWGTSWKQSTVAAKCTTRK